MTTLWDIRKMAIKELRERVSEEYSNLFDYHDAIHEIADSHVPVYTSSLMELAANNIRLATDVPELGPAFDGESTPVNIVAANVYEYLTQELFEAFEEARTA